LASRQASASCLFIPKPPFARLLSEALDFIQKEDGCSRAEAFEQFRQMALICARFPYKFVCLWGDRHPAAPAKLGPAVVPQENRPFSNYWEKATLEDNDRVCFGPHYRRLRLILVPWNNFLVIWKKPSTPRPPRPTRRKPPNPIPHDD
jgi:hypothetical protein